LLTDALALSGVAARRSCRCQVGRACTRINAPTDAEYRTPLRTDAGHWRLISGAQWCGCQKIMSAARSGRACSTRIVIASQYLQKRSAAANLLASQAAY
jgi:hypothetical protein